MKKKMLAAVLAVSMIALMAAFATSAQAFPSKTVACTGCHSKSTTVKISAVQTANTGGRATYRITVTGPNSLQGWAVLSGSTNLAHATAGSGSFTVADGKTYTIWAVSKTSSSMPYSNSLSISPVAPPAPPTPTPTPTPVPTATPTPTSTPAAKGTAVFLMHFNHPRGVVVRLSNAAAGRTFVGRIGLNNRITFRNVPNGTYVLTVKYPRHRVRVIGRYHVVAGKVTRMAALNTQIDD